MKTKILFITAVSLALGILSCKKKDKTPDPTPEPTPTPVVEGTRGMFENSKVAFGTGTNVSIAGSSNKAYFSTQDLYHNAPIGSPVDIGTVSMNAIVFKKNYPMSGWYYDSTANNSFVVPQVWNVSGSGNLSAFSYTNNNGFPIFNGYTSIPDSFVIAGGVNIPLVNFSGADEIQTMIYSSTSYTKTTGVQYLPATATSVNFSASEMNTVGTCTNGVLTLYFYKNNIQEINGKKINFRTGYCLSKSGIKLK